MSDSDMLDLIARACIVVIVLTTLSFAAFLLWAGLVGFQEVKEEESEED